MLSAKDIADILGKAQVLAATWMVQGGFVFQREGQTLSVNDTDGIQLQDLYGKAQLRLPIAGPPFLFGRTSTAITPNTTVHIGDGDFHGLSTTNAYNIAKTLACWQNGVSEIDSTGVAHFFLQQKYKNSGYVLGIESGIFLSHTSGSVESAWGARFFINFAGMGGTANALRCVSSNLYCQGATSLAYGVTTGITAQNSGTVATAYGYKLTILATTNAAITTAYGYLVDFINTTSTFTTAYGLCIQFTGDVVTKWGIYIADNAAKSYIQGYLGVGVNAPYFYEKLTVKADDYAYNVPAMWIAKRGTGLLVSHVNPTYYLSLCTMGSFGHPHIVLHGKHSSPADVFQNDGSGFRGIDIAYCPEGEVNNKSGLLVKCNKTVTADAAFTNYHNYLFVGRVLGLPALNSSEMTAQTTRPAGSMIWNTTRSMICVWTGAAWVNLGTTAYTDTHSDIPHEDSHGDTHTDSHGDAGHSNSYTDSPYSDVTHIDDHGDVTHEDSGHGDTHGDSHTDHTDGTHDDIAHTDAHGDSHTDSHTDSHGDSYIDTHTDVHGDVTHTDTHGDSPYVDTYTDEYTDNYPYHSDHHDVHGDTEHVDSHGDTAHVDTHSDVVHVDAYTDTHSDVPHYDSHGDTHLDVPHSDHTDDIHDDFPHIDWHTDASHADVPHTDTHADTAHVDTAHVDSHTDSTHTDTHGDTVHEDWHTDHSDAT